MASQIKPPVLLVACTRIIGGFRNRCVFPVEFDAAVSHSVTLVMCDDSEDAEAAASASDLEDLREQLSRQDEVYRGLREEISRETEKGEEFRELLGQLQKGGR